MQLLFSNELLSAYLDRYKINLQREIESQTPEYLFNVDEEAYASFLVSKYSLSPPALKEHYISEKKEEEKGGKPTVHNPSMFSGVITITISIPFEGERHLFKCRPSSYKMDPPSGNIGTSEIQLSYQTKRHNVEAIKSRYKKEVSKIQEYLQFLKKDLDNHNEWIRNNIKRLISERKDKLIRHQAFLKSFGLPIKRNEIIPETYAFPAVRKKVNVLKPDLDQRIIQMPEPVLSTVLYESILETIWHMSVAMERSPKTFSKLSEPEIRDFFVIHLNGHFEGHATGETFNYTGKTDILIRVEGRNIFIAECKFWDGKDSLISTIDQILGYTSWRDTKTAIFSFNKNKDFSKVLDKIEKTVISHKFYKRKHELNNEQIKCETIFSYVFQHPSDAERELFLTILAFDIPS
jgi:hypothetical protein